MKKGLNVMLSLMQLDIGGAETHVVELAKELKRMGFNPIITSNGGVYVKELEEAGIKHYQVPLQNKNPLNMIKSVRLLKKIIIDEKIDLVHSHARIPSFILGKLHKLMKFPFVTSAHWVFTTRYGLKYITDWGEKTVAVSEDIKTYLMDNYKIPESNIRVTINGIDTDKFSPDTDVTDIRREFDINEDDTVIVYVSRMDESRSLVAKHLISVAEEIDKFTDNLKIVIVGNGDDFANVSAMTEKVNKNIGRKCISLAGARTDINKFAALADLFVGVSRAALEAMAACKPVIIAGNEGYIGLFEEDKLGVGIDTNFCCRGCEQSSPQLLLEDIKKYFGMDSGRKEELAVFGRELIKREYSVARMAQDTVKVYEWALDKNDEILVSGYYGFKNSGDDALLAAILAEIKKHKESPEIVVLSANPKETVNRYRVKAINRLNPFSVLRHMKKAGLLISGGGTLIQNSTSTRSMLYYLSIISAAIRNNVKVMLYSNGIGPLRGKQNINLARKVLNKTDVITLRDPDAMAALKDIGVTEPEIFVTADPVFGICVNKTGEGRKILESFNVPAEAEKILGVSVRRSKDTNAVFEREIAKMCDYASEKYGYYTIFIPMQLNRDEMISNSIMSKMKSKASIIDKRLDVDEMISVIGATDLCIGMRLHSLIYSTINSIPLIGIAYDPKIKSFMDYIGQNHCMDIKDISAEEGIKYINDCHTNYELIKRELNVSYERLSEKARENGKLAIELYEKGSAGA